MWQWTAKPNQVTIAIAILLSPSRLCSIAYRSLRPMTHLLSRFRTCYTFRAPLSTRLAARKFASKGRAGGVWSPNQIRKPDGQFYDPNLISTTRHTHERTDGWTHAYGQPPGYLCTGERGRIGAGGLVPFADAANPASNVAHWVRGPEFCALDPFTGFISFSSFAAPFERSFLAKKKKHSLHTSFSPSSPRGTGSFV